jgi:hypothetical protein
VTKISDKKYIPEDSGFPQVYYKYLWLLGQFVQHSLLYLEGVRVPEPPELKPLYPDKDPAELINLQRELYGCQFDWDTGSVIVKYHDSVFDISTEAKKITIQYASKHLADLLGFDDNGFDFNKACTKAVEIIINHITSGQKKPM